MTLPPLDTFDVRPVEGPKYKVGNRCASPMCNRFSDHAHHLFRRSRHGNADWVELPDGVVVGNRVPLCARCHELITGVPGAGHVHAIRWHEGQYWWANVTSQNMVLQYHLVAPLSWQPPRPGEEAVEQINACPTCGKRRHARKPKTARKRKTWTVQVPADDEDGAQVMDDLVEALVPVFNIDPDGGAMTRYHTLARALAFTLVNRESIPEEAKVSEWTSSL